MGQQHAHSWRRFAVIATVLAVLLGSGVTAMGPTPAAATTEPKSDNAPGDAPPPSGDATPPATGETSDTVAPSTPAPSPPDAEAAPQDSAEPGMAAKSLAAIAPLSLPVAGRPYLAFSVRDTEGNLVPGATVNLQGARNSGGNSGTTSRWPAAWSATDCTVDPCPASSLDQDSAPGVFKVDRSNAAGSQLSSTSRYRIGASATVPSGYAWTTPTATATTDTGTGSENWVATISGTQQNAAAGQWVNSGSNMVHTFAAAPILERVAPICATGYVYAIGGTNGQMQEISPTGAVRNLGGTTGSNAMNGLGIASDGTGTAWAFSRGSNTDQAQVYRYTGSTGTWARALSTGTNTWDIDGASGLQLVGGAVAPNGAYFVGGFETSGALAANFSLWSTNAAGTAMVSRGYLNIRATGTTSGTFNGDFAFDEYGNLYLARNDFTGTTTRVTIFRASATDLAGATTGTAIPVTQLANNDSLMSGVNGVAFDLRGRLYLGGSNTLRWVSLPSPGTANSVTLSGATMVSTDLASCSYPPTVKLQKRLPNGRVAGADRFGLELRNGGTVSGGTISGGTVLGTATAQSPASGVQDQSVGAFPITAGERVTFAETFTNGASAANYASGWQCTVDGESTPRSSGSGTAGEFSTAGLVNGEQLVCEFVNSIMQPEKTADPVSLTPVDAEAIVTYTLRFDNSEGLGPATVNSRDFLRDVLDDAAFINAAGATVSAPVWYPAATNGVSGAWDAANARINVSGAVPAGTVGTLSFRVRVLGNDVNTAARQSAAAPLQGFLLRNYLTPGTVTTPPATCAAPAQGQRAMCTEHSVAAWTIEKTSQPEDGAMIHSGGNIYYRVKVTNFGATDISGILLDDDLTQTLAATVIDPAAPPAVAVPNGITYYEANGNRVASALDQSWNSVNVSNNGVPAGAPNPALPTVNYRADGQGGCSLSAQFADDIPGAAAGCWTYTPPAFTLPAMINGKRIAYAIVGYAVKGGQAAAAATPTLASSTPIRSNASWVNTAQGREATFAAGTPQQRAVYPSACSAANGGVPVGWDSSDPAFEQKWGACKTYHLIGESYFHIWKKYGPVPIETPNNLDGANFLLADSEALAQAGEPSRWLCRVNNNPFPSGSPVAATLGVATRPGGAVYRAPGSLPSTSGATDFGANSATANAIQAWNNEAGKGAAGLLPGQAQVEQCGTFFRLTAEDQGQAKGSWRAMNVRGGDTTGGNPQDPPKVDWRTTSALNACDTTPSDTSCGRRGTYWLIETQAPAGYELLPRAMKMWVAPSSPVTGNPAQGTQAYYDFQGRLSLPSVGQGESSAGVTPMPGSSAGTPLRVRCENPWQLPADLQPNCVMPTGWTMPVFDTAARRLPFTGGMWLGVLTGAGAVAILAAVAGALWVRRRRSASTSYDRPHNLG
ncbi:DUF7927 domain-containing protein [Leucobacter sp. VD1]|uniref:DUF7927 domain-containing protein n=1 Tax=Leucobacter sp. VD1 TaxID=3080381 RepID=UPI003015A6A7